MPDLPTDKLISSFYDSTKDCVKVVDTEGILLSFNPNGLRVMEIDDKKDVIGKSWLDFWKGDIQNDAIMAINNAKKGKMASFEGYCPTFKGNMRYWEVSIAPLNNEFNEVQWLIVTSHDATYRRELEDIITEQKAHIKELTLKLNKQKTD